jgi:hypothetical protein
MSDPKYNELLPLLEVFKHLKPTQGITRPISHFTKSTIKCVCGKEKHITDLERIETGVVTATSNVCRDCKAGQRHDRTTVRIVCIPCKLVVARMAPRKDIDGFQFEANRTYHIDGCLVCKPGHTDSTILEQKIYQNRTIKKGMEKK